MKSITYWNSFIYSLFVRLSHRGHYTVRYKAVANLIDNNSSIIDVCCGDCKIYDFLKNKNIDYLGLDFNQSFINTANKKGIKAKLFNIYKDEIPRADYILMQGALYQFMPNHDWVLSKLYNASDRFLIISEAVENYASSRSRPVSLTAILLNNPGDGFKVHRFDINALKKAMQPYRHNIVKEFYTASGIEYVIMVEKSAYKKP